MQKVKLIKQKHAKKCHVIAERGPRDGVDLDEVWIWKTAKTQIMNNWHIWPEEQTEGVA